MVIYVCGGECSRGEMFGRRSIGNQVAMQECSSSDNRECAVGVICSTTLLLGAS